MATLPQGWALCWLIAGNINNEKEHKFNLPFMVCVPLSPARKTVKNEAFGCCRVTVAKAPSIRMGDIVPFSSESVKPLKGLVVVWYLSPNLRFVADNQVEKRLF